MKVSAKKSIGKRALALLLALLMAVTALSLAASTQAASAGEGGSARVLADSIDTELDALKSNIDTYEEMMDGKHLYTNMASAYEKYCAACEAYYENYYGYDYEDGATVHTQSKDEVTSANTALEEAIEAMEPYTGYVGEATTAADGDYTSDESVASSTSAGLLMQKDDDNSYTVDCNTEYGTDVGTTVPSMGDGHNSIEMYDELSGVMYTYGTSNQTSSAAAGNYGAGHSATSSSGRLGSKEVNVGLIYGSVVFLYTGTEHSEGIQTTDTYAVPINSYINCAQQYKDQTSISYLGVNFDSDDYRMNGGAFELHRGWHGWLEYETHTSFYVDDSLAYYEGTAQSQTESNGYENHFFGYTEGFGYYSQSSYYSDICLNGITGTQETSAGLLYRSHTPDHYTNMAGNYHNSVYSNTLYYTGDPKTSVANKDTTKIAGESTSSVAGTDTYYAQYDLLDFTYYSMSGGNSGTGNANRKRSGCFGNYWLIRPVRSGTSGSVTGYYSNNEGSSGSGHITADTLPTFLKAVEDFETTGNTSGFYSSTTSNNSFASNSQPGGAADSYIYVVDYEPVLDAVDEYMQYTKIADSDSNTYYRYGSENMKAILSAFDTITEYNPNSAFSSNSTTLDVAGTVETVANNLKNYTSALETAIENNTIAASEASPTSAAKPLADTDEDLVVLGFDTVSYTIHDMVQTGYDEATGTSDKYNFLTENNEFVTSGTEKMMGVYEYYDGETRPSPRAMSSASPTSVKPLVDKSYEYTTIRGTVGETRATYTVTISRADDDPLMGHEFNSEVFAAYYGATEGAQDSVTGGFLHSVFTSVTEKSTEVDGVQAVDYTANITVYAKEAELYAFESAREYQIYYILKDRTNYSTSGSITMTQTDSVTIGYYTENVTEAVPTTFVWQGALYQLSPSDTWSGTGIASVSRTDLSKGDVTYTWLYTEAYHTSAREVNVYYKRVPVNVVYASYSVIIESGTNSIIGDATQTDGYVKVKGAEDSTATEQFSEQTTAAYDTYVTETENYPVSGPVGATAVPNTNTENGEQASFIRWYLLDKAPGEVGWEDFAKATAVSGSWGDNVTISPNLVDDMRQAGLAASTATEEDIIGAWNEETTYYYYALFTADEPDTSTKHLQVTLVLDDWNENYAVEAGAQFIVNVTDHVSDGLDMDISYVAEIGENGEVTLTFDLLPGTCVVEINTDFAYGYSLVIDTTDEHNQEDGTQRETINTGTEDEHHLTFHLVYNPLNTAENNSDSKTNNYTGNSSSSTEG